MSELRPFAFVLMPFEPTFDDIYKLGIQAIAKELDVVAERVDEQSFSESILERIYRQIDAADFIIADMTGKNPNVFYEVGYAHAKGKLCTLLTQNTDDIPFDLRHHRHLVYGGSIQTLKAQLKTEIEWLKNEYSKSKSETISVVTKNPFGTLVKTDWDAEVQVELVFDIHNKSEVRTPEIEAMYLHTGEQWRYEQGKDECPSTESEIENYRIRHFIKPPVVRLSPGTWAQVKMFGRKRVWWKYSGDELRDSYRLTGPSIFEIVTSEGSFRNQLNFDLLVDEIPF